MNGITRIYPVILLICAVLIWNHGEAGAESAEDSITILFTHDLHDHFMPFEVKREGKTMTVGGYARLYSAIQEQRAKDPDALLVDAGDLSMGTLFQTVFTTDAPGLRMMGHMGYDAITLGNHEFDFRAEGLAKSLRAARDSGEQLPAIVASNMVFPEEADAGVKMLQEEIDVSGVKDYLVIERKGVKIGIIGLMGEEAAGNAPMSGVSFDDAVKSAKATVDALKKKEDVDLVIALSHSGTAADPSRSEDEILAKKVPEIDVIISGHSHTAFDEPIIAGDTMIGSSGEYGENLGVLNISPDENGRWKVDQYELRKVDDTLPSNPEVSQMIEDYKEKVQKEYLQQFGMKFDEVLAYSPFDFTPFSQLGAVQREEPIGNLIGDSFIHMVRELEGSDYEPVTAAVVPVGTIRDSFGRGEITASQVFNVNSLGIGPDGISGYPLLDIYLTGKELKTVAEVDASITPIMNSVQLYIAGLSYTFNTERFLFNKVTDISLQTLDGTREEIDDEKLYRVVGGLYSVQMLPFVNEKSFGLLSVVPKHADGTPVENFEDRILYMNDHQEVKEWYAIANYLSSFEKVNGVAQIPDEYERLQGRKIVEQDAGLLAVLKHPNGIILSAYGLVLAFIGILTGLIVLILKRRKRRVNSRKMNA